jgi:hypothetical protein
MSTTLITVVESLSRYGSIRLTAGDSELFVISMPTERGNYGMHIESRLPGIKCPGKVTALDGADSYSPAEDTARQTCAQALQRWLASTFGISAIVQIVTQDNEVKAVA